MKRLFQVLIATVTLASSLGAWAAKFHGTDTDGSIDGSVCLGRSCETVENFFFDSLILKDTQLRIYFLDTSTLAGFPTNDWRIVINDIIAGDDFFAIEDTTGGDRVVFKIEAGAHSNSLYVDDAGNIGLGTNSPVVELHFADGDTPTIRLEQDGTSGFTPQTWDVAGNEGNFFIRDVTNGSTSPFRIRPGAPTSAIDIAAGGNVGIGTASPENALHVKQSDGSARILVEETNAAAAPRTLFQLKNKGNTKFGIVNTDANVEWAFANPGTSFRLSRQGSGVVEMDILNNGNVTIAGTLTQNSDVNEKTAITAINADEILKLVTRLPVNKWEYKDALGESHIGPMAQDFYAAFGLGATDTGISSIDTGGVALAAIQALNQKLVEQNLSLKQRAREIEQRVADLEQLVMRMVTNQAEQVAIN